VARTLHPAILRRRVAHGESGGRPGKDIVKYRRALAKLLMISGALALLGGGAGGGYLVMVLRRGFSARAEPSGPERWLAPRLRRASIPARARRLVSPIKPTPEVLAAARAHFADHCALCHANNGSGATPLGSHMYPRPPDLRRPPTQRLTDGELYYTIQQGVRLTGMPAFGAPGDDDRESWGLVALIRHLPQLTAAEEKEMESLNPKSNHERREEQREDEFLREPDAPEETRP